MIGAFGLTEPNHGSDPAGMETRVILLNINIEIEENILSSNFFF